MKKISQLALVLFALSASAQQDFSKFKWRNRILVFSAPSLSDEAFRSQWNSFTEQSKKLEDRNLLLFVLVKGKIYDKELKPTSNFDVSALRKKYDLPASYSGLVLIGKDGGSKLKRNYPIEPRVVYEAIDQMPMRQREMRENIED